MNRLYQKHVHISGKKYSKVVEMWWKICLDLVAKNSTNIIEEPPSLPDMTPADFSLFPKLKLLLRGTRFQPTEDIKENSQRELKLIPENAFEKYFDDWIIRWHKCVISGRAYFEVDKINLDE